MSEIHYYANYANTHDIDCFFRIGTVAYHFASNGNKIPTFITRKTNIQIQTEVYEMLPNGSGEVDTRRETIRGLIQRELEALEGNNGEMDGLRDMEQMINDYAVSFQNMACLGFVSMDLDEKGVFHIIAKPIGQNVPEELLMKIPEVREEEVELKDRG